MADFVTEHVGLVGIRPWTIFFDGSVCQQGGGVGLLLISPRGSRFEFAVPISEKCSNNQAEYEALLQGLKLMREIEADAVEAFGDSLLVTKQINQEYEMIDSENIWTSAWRLSVLSRRLRLLISLVSKTVKPMILHSRRLDTSR